MKLASIALLALPCLADTITYNTSLVDHGSFASPLTTFSEAFIVPQFDPSLGTLDVLTYTLVMNGHYSWHADTSHIAGPFSLFSSGDMSFMGWTRTWFDANLTGSGLCGFDGYPQCIDVWGTVSSQGVSMHSFMGNGSILTMPDGFVGSSTVDLPVEIHYTPIINELITGTLNPIRTTSLNLSWKYTYTPFDPETVIATAAPEPRFLMLMGFVFLCLLVRSYRSTGAQA